MRSLNSFVAVLALAFALPAGAAGEHAGHDHAAMGMGRPVSWTAYPTLKVRTGGDRMTSSVAPQNIVAGAVVAWSNRDGHARRELPLEMAGARLDKPESGGFHWLSAREESADRVVVASTVHYFGERGAVDPTAMFMQQKHELEIVPQPFPREHSRYRADEEWKFLLRFNGQPLGNQKLVLETSNGGKAQFLSDAEGVVKVHLPHDFKAEDAQASGRIRGADFVLATEHAANGKTYLTAFNSGYGPDAYDKRSLAMGLGFMLLGMAGAVPLLRKRKQKEAGHA